MVASQLKFLKEFLNKPHQIGALTPSSKELVNAVVALCDPSRARVVVELGPGTGPLTKKILPRLGPRTSFIAIERNERFIRHLKRRFPGARFVHGFAEDTPRILEQEGLPSADVVLSALPWASFDDAIQRRILNAIYSALAPEGQFCTVAYTTASWLPRGRNFRGLLRATFSRVRVSPIVWMNIPPAFAYVCRK
ncbi:MAG: methyltransferase domain-containing protein [Planctomycetes bacterium]|nr:methyltransferase domain-containing protein [Planctomycetota bacterium]